MEQVRSELNNSNDLDQNGVYGRDRMWGIAVARVAQMRARPIQNATESTEFVDSPSARAYPRR